MKTKYIKLLAVAMLAIFAWSSCTDFDELNRDPNKSTNMDPDLLISTVQWLPSSDWQRMHRLFIYPAGFMNQWTGSWSVVYYAGEGRKNTGYFEYLWSTSYPEVIKNVIDVVERTKDNPEKINSHAIGRILKVQNFMRLTDYYGDIPYSEAGMGYYTGNLKPKYDKQEDIYADFLNELKEAEAQLDPSMPAPRYDHYYNGDINKWKKYANSLRLRVAMRLVKVNPALAEAEAKAAIQSGVFTSNDDICYIQHEDINNGGVGVGQGNAVANLLNPSSAGGTTGSIFWFASDFIKPMENMNDPRIRYIAGAYLNDVHKTDVTDQVFAQRGSYAAMCPAAQGYSYDANPDYPNAAGGVDVVDANGETVTLDLAYTRLRPSNAIDAYDSPYIHMSYAEIAFLKAEVETRWGSPANAATFYADGLRAAVEQWTLFGINVDGTQADAFANASLQAGKGALYNINMQLWILHFLDPLESWANWRRSGYPEVTYYNRNPSVNTTNGQTPRRIQYLLEEQKKNAVNLQEAVDRLGGSDDWTGRVWWDK